MSFSQAKARRFIDVLEDIIARIPTDPADFPELALPPMLAELNQLATELEVEKPIATFSYAVDEQARQVQLEFDRRLKERTGDARLTPLAPPALELEVADELAANHDLTRERVQELLWKPYAHDSLWLEWRTRYGGRTSIMIWRMSPVRKGPLAGSSVKETQDAGKNLRDFVKALREWQRWAQLIVDQNAKVDTDRPPGNASPPKVSTKRTKSRSDKLSKRVRIRLQRNKFSEPLRKRDMTWQAIYDKYRLRYSNDLKASADNLRHAFERDPDKTDSSDN